MAKKIFRSIGLLIFLGCWAGMLYYGHWYMLTGWDQPNAIMKYCATLNHTELGWFKYVCGHGVLNFVAGYGAVYPVAAPLIFLVEWVIQGGFFKAIRKTVALFFVLLFAVAICACCLYSVFYFITVHWLLAGLFILCSIFAVLSSCVSTYTVFIVKD